MNEDIILLDTKEKKYEWFWNLSQKKVQNIEHNVTIYNNKYGYRYRVMSGTGKDIEDSDYYSDWESFQGGVHDNLVREYNNDETNQNQALLEAWVRDN